MWIPYITYCIYLGVFSFLQWKRQVLLLYFMFAVFIILLNIYYDKISIILYMGIFLMWTLYLVIWIFISFKLKELIILLKTNKDLIHTIQTILQVFPEGVIIRSLDETSKQTILKFANNIAKKDLDADAHADGQQTDVKIKLVDSNNASQDTEAHNLMRLERFLGRQEQCIIDEDADWAEQMIKVKHSIDHLQNEFVRNIESDEYRDEAYFNVKSIRVSWDNNKESFMHVFVNTTEVKKLENEKAKRQYQHMMFANLSHELRTPLNAFSNSLSLIQLTFNEIKSKYDRWPEVSNEVESLYPRIYKFIKIGEVSSCLLMNLVEDILDMSKFNAKTFQLNINAFRLGDLLKDIDYIFGFQWAEKHINFSIDWPASMAGTTYWSDSKRIKQVLINLVSNSLKFTERGRIAVKVREFERDDDEYLKFEVTDTGVGISKQDIPMLFKMFGLLSKHRSKLNQSGNGLGLSISKRIVESLGGKIRVKSQENEFTKFIFSIKISKLDINISEENKEGIKDIQSLIKNNEEVKVTIINMIIYLFKLHL